MDNLKVKEALSVLYKNYNLQPDGGVFDSSVKIELVKGFSIYIPNFEARKKVVLKHDIHHLVTGYSAVMKGETEISAWELSSGCSKYWLPFTINTYGMMMGVPFNLIGIWRAWVRGRNTRNLYAEKYKTELLLNQSVEELKAELGFLTEGTKKSNSFFAFLSFAGFLVFGALFLIISIILIPFVVIYSLSISLQKLWQKT